MQAGGNLGQSILKELVDSQYDVTIISRANSKSTFEGIPTQNVVRGEYTPEFFRKALQGQDSLVLAIGSEALDSQKAIIDVAAEVGVRRIIPSEFGGVSIQPLGNEVRRRLTLCPGRQRPESARGTPFQSREEGHRRSLGRSRFCTSRDYLDRCRVWTIL